MSISPQLPPDPVRRCPIDDPTMHTRACLKNAFCEMCFTVCGEFIPNLGVIAGYVD